MAKIKFDVSGEDADRNSSRQSYELPPAGLHPAKIKTASAEEPENKNPRLHVVIEITKPAKNNFAPIHEYITFTDASKWKLDQFLQAVGVASKAKRTGEFEDSKLVGKTLQVYLTHETDTWEGNTRTKARVANFLAKSTKVAGEAASEEVAEEEDDLDTLGNAADEGDEEAQGKLTDLAEAAGLDPDEYESWLGLAGAITSGGSDEAEEEEEEEAEDGDGDGDDLDALAEAADADDEDAQGKITDLAEAAGVDPDEYETWVEVVAAINESGGEEEEEAEVLDYESMGVMALKKVCKERDIPSGGTKEELVVRLQEFDGVDPFAG